MKQQQIFYFHLAFSIRRALSVGGERIGLALLCMLNDVGGQESSSERIKQKLNIMNSVHCGVGRFSLILIRLK